MAKSVSLLDRHVLEEHVMYVCMYVLIYGLDVCMYVLYVCMYVMYVVYVCMYVFRNVFTLCIYVCMCVLCM